MLLSVFFALMVELMRLKEACGDVVQWCSACLSAGCIT